MTKGRCVDGCVYYVKAAKQCSKTFNIVKNSGRYCVNFTNKKSLFAAFRKWFCKLFS